MKAFYIVFSFLIIEIINGLSSAAQNFTFIPVMDNTIFSESDSSNGSGTYLFSGTTNQGGERRALLKFDLTSLQPDIIITSADLKLYLSKTIHDEKSVSLYRLASNWGEGNSKALGEEGMGATPKEGEATWNYAFYDTVSWTTAGGDYINLPSATTQVNQTGSYYSWTGPGVVSDVNQWVTNPSENFGWIVITEGALSAKRFNSRENSNFPPQLIVNYTTTSLQKNSLQENIILYPNPSHGTFNIQGLSGNNTYRLSIFSITGEELINDYVQASNEGFISVNIPEKGIYFIRIDGLMAGKEIIF